MLTVCDLQSNCKIADQMAVILGGSESNSTGIMFGDHASQIHWESREASKKRDERDACLHCEFGAVLSYHLDNIKIVVQCNHVM